MGSHKRRKGSPCCAKERILLANSSLWGELTKNRREFGQNWGQDAVQSAESHGLWGENR